MAKKRIAVLSMSSGDPRLMLAGVDDGQVSIVKCEELPRSMLTLKLKLPSKLKNFRDKGFVVLVDEIVPYFAKYGRAVSMDDKTANGLPLVVAAMQAYTSLKSLQSITFPKGDGGRYEISPSLVEQIRGADGKITYNIAWDELRPDTYALLFAIYAATQDSLLDSSTLKDVFSLLGNKNQPESVNNRMNAVMEARTNLIYGGNDE
ncbi:hypothetical protein [Vibrio harveyi]|jgi:hypothetical protein|uniref:Maturation control protein n=1 Tax=Vibrio harveyi TaxID=669 RepID=A0A8B3DT87_VIBHA|nr:hypothetical protein [Vibrio harveyi]RIW17906.1 hypothetical protein DS957_003830 [Vibrio harveyi]